MLRWVNVALGIAAVVCAFAFELDQVAAILAIGAGTAAVIASATDRADPHFRGRWLALLSGKRG